MSDKHPNSRTITIFRAERFIQRAQGTGADEYFAASRVGIGSYFESVNSQKIGTGLSFTEEDLLLPYVLDIPSDDREFRKKVSEFYGDINTDVPFRTGAELEIGLNTSNDRPVSKDNLPIKVMDYLRYRHALKHPKVAITKEAGDGNMTKEFYIFDKENVQSKNSKKTQQMDKALEEYLKIKNKPEEVEQMLTLLGVDPREFTGKDRENLMIEALREKAEKTAEKFLEAFEQGDLQIRAWIVTMVNTGVLKKVGQKYLETQNSETIGNSMDEAIAFFKDEDQSAVVTMLKARMQEAIKAPLPKKTRQTIV